MRARVLWPGSWSWALSESLSEACLWRWLPLVRLAKSTDCEAVAGCVETLMICSATRSASCSRGSFGAPMASFFCNGNGGGPGEDADTGGVGGVAGVAGGLAEAGQFRAAGRNTVATTLRSFSGGQAVALLTQTLPIS